MDRLPAVCLLLILLGGCEPASETGQSRRVAVPERTPSAVGDGPAPHATTVPPRRIATH